MSSSVFFKFKSQKEPSRVTFDGTGISVFELKKEIISINRLGDGTEFDLAIHNEDTNEEYKDDTTIIPRSTSITARRTPPAKAGRGSAARYVSGKMPVNARNASRMETSISKPAVQVKATAATTGFSTMNVAQTEEEKEAAMFKAQADIWQQQQQEMANATPVYRGNAGSKGKNVTVPEGEPPAHYLCYRCRIKGHWIQACPTNDDPNFENRPRIKRTTGIPRSFLKTVEKPAALSNDGLTDDSRQPSGVMVNAEGDYVVAEPDKKSWEQYQAKAKVSAAAQEAAAAGSQELRKLGLECPIDKRMFVDPMKTPCCGRTYCNECINTALVESDLVCPGCASESVLIDDLVSDDDTNAKIKAYEEGKTTVKREEEKSKTPVIKKEEKSSNDNANAGSPSGAASPNRASTLTPIVALAANPKKRPAEDEIENHHVPKGPAAMISHESRPQQAHHGNFDSQNFNQRNNALPNLPFMQQQQQQHSFANGNFMSNQGMNHMTYPHSNAFSGIPASVGPMMGIDSSMMNPMGMPSIDYTGSNGTGWNGMGGMSFPPQQSGTYGGLYSNSMMPNGAYTQPSMSIPMGNGSMNASSMNMNPMHQQMMPNGRGTGVFPNQQRTIFSEPFPNEEDNAYFRKPVNPQRHQARQRRVRPSDYREL
ncbi:MAG: hypothetical protein M1827_004624 [Pycnora praestabilis]|nr:MAG: hypothetical protein M1827_004624 [Pycnora praestabilis]